MYFCPCIHVSFVLLNMYHCLCSGVNTVYKSISSSQTPVHTYIQTHMYAHEHTHLHTHSFTFSVHMLYYSMTLWNFNIFRWRPPDPLGLLPLPALYIIYRTFVYFKLSKNKNIKIRAKCLLWKKARDLCWSGDCSIPHHSLRGQDGERDYWKVNMDMIFESFSPTDVTAL